MGRAQFKATHINIRRRPLQSHYKTDRFVR